MAGSIMTLLKVQENPSGLFLSPESIISRIVGTRSGAVCLQERGGKVSITRDQWHVDGIPGLCGRIAGVARVTLCVVGTYPIVIRCLGSEAGITVGGDVGRRDADLLPITGPIRRALDLETYTIGSYQIQITITIIVTPFSSQSNFVTGNTCFRGNIGERALSVVAIQDIGSNLNQNWR
jgi:hypothetical protein